MDKNEVGWLEDLISNAKLEGGYSLDGDEKAILSATSRFKIIRGKYQDAQLPNDLINEDIESWDIANDYAKRRLSPAIKKRKQSIRNFIKQFMRVLPLLCSGEALIFQSSSGVTREARNLWLRGRSQSGKSLLATLIAKHGVELGLKTRYYNWVDIARAVLNVENQSEYQSVYNDCLNFDLIVIDGVKPPNSDKPYVRDQLEALALARLRSGKCTIITSDTKSFNLDANHPWYSLVKTCRPIDLPSPVTEV